MRISCISMLSYFPNTDPLQETADLELFVSGQGMLTGRLHLGLRRREASKDQLGALILSLPPCSLKQGILYSGCVAFLFISILKKVNSSSTLHMCLFLRSGIISESILLLS